MHIHWKTNSTDATGGDIVWEYEYTISNPANGSAETYVAATQVTQTIPAGNRQHLANSFDIVTIPGTGLGVSFLFSWTLKRLGGAGGDNYPASVFPFSISLHHQMDTVGSNMQNSKN
jgi:hypothetical protein